MCKWMTLLAILGSNVLWGCSGAQGAQETSPPAAPIAPPAAPRALPAGSPAPAERRLSRTIEDDPDADGIANYRVVITEIFDPAGNLVSTWREEDFEADGIIDSRQVTSFSE